MATRNRAKISISGKVSRSQATMYGKLQAVDQESKCTNSEDLLKILYTNIGTSLNGLLQNFSAGKFLEVKNDLTIDKYNQLSIVINNNTRPNFLYYEIIRLLFSKTLDGLMQSVNQYIQLLDTASKLEKCTEYSSILDDPEKLKDYINQLNNQRYLFDVEPITMVETVIKQEYLEYIKLYGFPEGGIFESNKLGDIIFKIQNNLPMTPLAGLLTDLVITS